MNFNYKQEPGVNLAGKYITEAITPIITIITPYYNAGEYFPQTFNSVINQTFPWYEWIIVDDGSNQKNDVEILEKVARQDIRIKVLHKENGGISSARNVAIQNASTDYIITLDADDLIEPNYCECLYFGLLYNPEYDWCYTNSIGFGNQEYVWNQPFDAERLKTYNFLTYSGIIRKSALLDVGCYDESEKHFFEDWHLWLRLIAKGHYPVKLQTYSFWYRRLDTGVLHKVTKNKLIRKRAELLIKGAADKVNVSLVKCKDYARIHGRDCFSPLSKYYWSHEVKKNDKINIILIIPWMQMGGADVFNLTIAQKIDKEKYNLIIVITKPDQNVWLQKFSLYVDEIYDVSSFLDEVNYTAFMGYLIESREVKAVIISQSYLGYYLIPWLRMEYPYLAILDYLHLEEKYWRSGGYARTSGVFGDIIDKTYVCNNVTKEVLIDSYSRKPDTIRTIYIGVDKEQFLPKLEPKADLYRTFGLDYRKKIILFLCRMMPQKRPFLMLEIARKMCINREDFIFLVVGDGLLLGEMKEYVKKHSLENVVKFTGSQNDVVPFYTIAYLTLICSMKEGLALTAYESLATGTPVISADVGGQRELIDNQVGRLVSLHQDENRDYNEKNFPMIEIQDYIDAISDLMDHPDEYTKCCKNARIRIESMFSTDSMINSLELEILEQISDKYFNIRNKVACSLRDNIKIIEDYLTVYEELNMMEENAYGFRATDTKDELMRIANSKWGQRLIKLAFKLKLNKLF